ncbi:purine permease [Gossypium arboreum]|uniref:Purine permease n=1 Tax=Gossypium arboreum TaxID=29729 RepID=A0A0B0NWY5_GOSAR|nr:purine permease [Gossypium arboreum]
MVRVLGLIMLSVSMEKEEIGEKRPMKLNKNLIISSCVNQQNGFCCCFDLLLLNTLVLIGTTRFCAPSSIRSIASNKLKIMKIDKTKLR